MIALQKLLTQIRADLTQMAADFFDESAEIRLLICVNLCQKNSYESLLFQPVLRRSQCKNL
ncbi:MAG: hypothetical protein EAZ30_08415 [Betaproteobacteria bacterium]|nr:MAG: hypothetical protein EAZ30_08415 [Betaproteobacteria bacterium]